MKKGKVQRSVYIIKYNSYTAKVGKACLLICKGIESFGWLSKKQGLPLRGTRATGGSLTGHPLLWTLCHGHASPTLPAANNEADLRVLT